LKSKRQGSGRNGAKLKIFFLNVAAAATGLLMWDYETTDYGLEGKKIPQIAGISFRRL
jgi:hypothetical protein